MSWNAGAMIAYTMMSCFVSYNDGYMKSKRLVPISCRVTNCRFALYSGLGLVINLKTE